MLSIFSFAGNRSFNECYFCLFVLIVILFSRSFMKRVTQRQSTTRRVRVFVVTMPYLELWPENLNSIRFFEFNSISFCCRCSILLYLYIFAFCCNQFMSVDTHTHKLLLIIYSCFLFFLFLQVFYDKYI